MVHLHFQPLLAADKHSAGLGALVGSDDAFLFHLVHDTGRAGVAQLAAALQQAGGGLTGIDDHLHGLLEHRVGIGILVGVRAAAALLAVLNGVLFHGFDHGFVILHGAALLDEVQHTADLLIPHESALNTGRLGRTHGHEQHITHAQQLFGTGAVQNSAAVHLTGHCKCDAAGDVGLDQAGDHVHAGALGGYDQVHTGGAGLLGDAADGVLHILAHHHHQIGQLVDDNGDVGHLFQIRPFCGQLVERLDVAHIVLCKQMIAALHLLHRAAKGTCGLFRLGDHRHQQVGNAVVLGQLHHLGVDQQQLHVLRAGAEQQAHDDAVHAHGFTAAGAACNEQMGHLAQVCHLCHTGNVLAKRNAQR